MFVAFTFVTSTLPNEPVESKELDMSPIACIAGNAPEVTKTKLPNEPVDVNEPLTLAAFTTAEPLINVLGTAPKVEFQTPVATVPVVVKLLAVVIEFWVAVCKVPNTSVAVIFPNEPVDSRELVKSPVNFKASEPESCTSSLENEPVEVIEPLILVALMFAKPSPSSFTMTSPPSASNTISPATSTVKSPLLKSISVPSIVILSMVTPPSNLADGASKSTLEVIVVPLCLYLKLATVPPSPNKIPEPSISELFVLPLDTVMVAACTSNPATVLFVVVPTTVRLPAIVTSLPEKIVSSTFTLALVETILKSLDAWSAVKLPLIVWFPLTSKFPSIITPLKVPKLPLSNDAVDNNEPEISPIISIAGKELEPTNINLPNEPVEVNEPLTFAAFTTAEPLIKVLSALPKVTNPVADVFEFCVAVCSVPNTSVALTLVTFTAPNDAVDSSELVTLPKEPVDVIEPLTFVADIFSN